ncbi:hypothetical protein SAMN05216496_4011 [Pseudomonas sp. Z003-0.4C(8344-21)]|nr:hypothetical protein SAMN05216496_4011 [Pseudomonas sp. Z003-0.4C(8344-21)]
MPRTGHARDAAARCYGETTAEKRLRVILPSICRLPRPADNCHSNKYPLWVSAIDENAWSLRPQQNGWKRCYGECRGCSGRVQESVFRWTRWPHRGLARDGDVTGAAELSWPSPAADPPPTAAHGACHARTANRRFRPRGSAAPTARCRSGHGWPGRSPACRSRPCSAHR